MVDLLVVVAIAIVVVPLVATLASTRSPEAGLARTITRDHAGVQGRLGRVLLTFVRAAVYGRAAGDERARATLHVWTLGTKGPATVLVVFERPDVTSAWTHTAVLLRPWIPFAKPRELPSA